MIWTNISSIHSSHRIEMHGERQSWQLTPDSDKIGKGEQRWAHTNWRVTCFTFYLVWLSVCMFVSQSSFLWFVLVSYYAMQINQMKRSIQCTSTFTFAKRQIQCNNDHRTQIWNNYENIDGGCQTESIITGDNVCKPLSMVTPCWLCWPFNWCIVVSISMLTVAIYVLST